MRNFIVYTIGIIGCFMFVHDLFFFDANSTVEREEAQRQQRLDVEKGRASVPVVNAENGPVIPPNSIRIGIPPPVTDEASIERHVYGPTTYETPDGRVIEYYPTGPSGEHAFTHECGLFERHYRWGELLANLLLVSIAGSGLAITTMTVAGGGVSTSITDIPLGGFVVIPASMVMGWLLFWYVGVHALTDTSGIAKVMGACVDFFFDFLWHLLTAKFFH